MREKIVEMQFDVGVDFQAWHVVVQVARAREKSMRFMRIDIDRASVQAVTLPGHNSPYLSVFRAGESLVAWDTNRDMTN